MATPSFTFVKGSTFSANCTYVPEAGWQLYQSDNDSWHNGWSGYDKDATGATVAISN